MDEVFEIKKNDFDIKLEKLRTSKEQEAFQKKAFFLLIKSQIVFSAMLLTTVLTILTIWFDFHWYIWTSLLLLSLFLYQISQKLAFNSFVTNKEQDRIFLWKVSELRKILMN